jgi:hypothetical protein
MSELDRALLYVILLHVPLYGVWGWVLFRSWGAFWDAVCFLFKPELWSLLDGEYWDDLLAEAKLAVWFFVPIVIIAFELRLLGIV